MQTTRRTFPPDPKRTHFRRLGLSDRRHNEINVVLCERRGRKVAIALPTDAKERKELPIYSGVIAYFPDALIAVAELSRIGNDQHNPGKPLHWDRTKSGDELDALTRHLVEAGTIDTDGVRHSTKVAWRALANLQKEIERSKTGTEIKTKYEDTTWADPRTVTYEEAIREYKAVKKCQDKEVISENEAAEKRQDETRNVITRR